MRKIDLIATLDSSQILSPTFEEMVAQGLEMVRLNCSHLSVEELLPLTARLKSANIKVMLDLPGHEIRLQGLSENLPLEAGQTIHLGDSPQGLRGNFDAWDSLSLGMDVYIQGSEIRAQISKVYPDSVDIKIISGGILRPNASISFVGLDANGLSDQDPDLPYSELCSEAKCGHRGAFAHQSPKPGTHCKGASSGLQGSALHQDRDQACFRPFRRTD